MKPIWRGIATFAIGIVLLVSIALAGVMVVYPLVTGTQCYVITSGSMTGTIDQGSLIYDKVVPVSSLKRGDIITYSPPGTLPLVTHRIFSIDHKPDGTPVFQTRGDFNPGPDPWKFTLDGKTQAKYVRHIPKIGYVFAILSLPLARMLVLAVPAFVIGIAILWGVWKEAGEELRRREAAARPEEDDPEGESGLLAGRAALGRPARAGRRS